MPDLTPTGELLLEVLAARYRCGEKLWTFDSRHRWGLLALEMAGLVSLMHGIEPKTIRARLTEAGLAEVVSPSYNVPLPTLEQAIATLPATDDECRAWMRRHELGHGAGVGTVISLVRDDLEALLRGSRG